MNLSQLNRILRQALLLPMVALALVAGALAWQLLDAERAVTRIQLADSNIETATLITALMIDEETGLRAYQTTGDQAFLQPYEAAAEPLRANMRKLREGLQRQGADTSTLDTLRARHAVWVESVAETVIATIQAGGETRALDLNFRAKARMDEMRGLVKQIAADQNRRRTQAVDSWHAELRHTLAAIVLSALSVGLLIGTFARNQLHLVSEAFQRTLAALRQHAQATYDSEQRLRAILVSLGEAVVVCNLEGCIELMNPAAEQLSGWTQAEAAGKIFEEVFPLEGEATHLPAESAVVAVRRELRKIAPTEAFLLRRRDDSELTVDESGAPIYERNGDLAGVVLVLRDSTHQRRTQAALLASEKLAVAGRLAATIAHEIHNPLDSVANLLYLMKTATPEENQQFLDLAEGELSRATQISRALLGMYREARTEVALNVSSLLSSVLILLERRFSKEGVRVSTDLEDPAIITGFPAELRQVFTNLLVNAAEASLRGDTVEVRTATVMQEFGVNGTNNRRPGVLITITDHGQGITEAVHRKLFQPFFSTKGEAGTGLGLWVSKGIIDKHGGSIDLSSSADPEQHGTTVSVFLPRGQAEWHESTTARPASSVLPANVTSAVI